MTSNNKLPPIEPTEALSLALSGPQRTVSTLQEWLQKPTFADRLLRLSEPNRRGFPSASIARPDSHLMPILGRVARKGSISKQFFINQQRRFVSIIGEIEHTPPPHPRSAEVPSLYESSGSTEDSGIVDSSAVCKAESSHPQHLTVFSSSSANVEECIEEQTLEFDVRQLAQQDDHLILANLQFDDFVRSWHAQEQFPVQLYGIGSHVAGISKQSYRSYHLMDNLNDMETTSETSTRLISQSLQSNKMAPLLATPRNLCPLLVRGTTVWIFPGLSQEQLINFFLSQRIRHVPIHYPLSDPPKDKKIQQGASKSSKTGKGRIERSDKRVNAPYFSRAESSKVSKHSKTTNPKLPQEESKCFACPMSKHHPSRYSQVYGPCTMPPGIKEFKRVKEHLKVYHSAKQKCLYCRHPWENPVQFEAEMAEHFSVCAKVAVFGMSTYPEYLTAQQEEVLDQPRRAPSANKAWTALYQDLFPNEYFIPSPYYDFYTATHEIPVLSRPAVRNMEPESRAQQNGSWTIYWPTELGINTADTTGEPAITDFQESFYARNPGWYHHAPPNSTDMRSIDALEVELRPELPNNHLFSAGTQFHTIGPFSEPPVPSWDEYYTPDGFQGRESPIDASYLVGAGAGDSGYHSATNQEVPASSFLGEHSLLGSRSGVMITAPEFEPSSTVFSTTEIDRYILSTPTNEPAQETLFPIPADGDGQISAEMDGFNYVGPRFGMSVHELLHTWADVNSPL